MPLLTGFLAAIAVTGVAYFALPPGQLQDAAYTGCGLLALAALVLGPARHRPQERAAWWLLACGQLLFVVADATFAVYDNVLDVDPFPSAADAVYLTAYPVMALGLLRLARLRPRAHRLALAIDCAVLVVALALVSWALLADTLLVSQEPLISRWASASYPLADILLLALLVLLAMTPGARTPSFVLLCSAVALLLVADNGYAYLNAHGTYAEGGFTNAAWIASYALLGAAALHPSVRAVSAPAAAAPAGTARRLLLTRRRLVVLAVAVSLAPVTLVAQHLVTGRVDVWAVALSSLVLFGLGFARLSLLLGRLQREAGAREALQGDLAHAAAHDSLTQLANRAQVEAALTAALHRAQRAGTSVGLLFIDLDRFKAVNDTHGHGTGDEVLQVVAERLRAAVRAGDAVGRWGGDEFVAVVEPLPSEAALVELAQRVVAAAAEPVPTAAGPVVVGASVGVVVEDDGGTDASALLRDADTAAHRAKTSGRGRVEVFDEQLRRELAELAAVERDLRHALAHDLLQVHYQPVVAVADGRVCSYEALLRWDRPGHGPQSPDAFIPVAERTGLVSDLDRWVLKSATRQLARWRAEGAVDAACSVAVNISGRHLADPGVVSEVAWALSSSGLPADALVLEMTETVLVDQAVAGTHLDALRALGVRVSIDDFGTGYTSISQLQHLRADALKIDKSLVWSDSSGAAALVGLVVHAAHAFGLRVVAEGVEDAEQLRRITEAGCDEVQGFLLGRPEPLPQAQPQPQAQAGVRETTAADG